MTEEPKDEQENREFWIYAGIFICGLVFAAIPVFSFGALDITSALLLAGGLGLIVWAIVRWWSLRKK
jgi:hypothetical protein